MAEIEFDGVSKVFADGTVGLEALSLDVADGEFIVLVGPSGSGKSTALRILAGLEEETAGTVRIGERVVNDLEPKDRDVAMVFQSYALYPHMTVAANLGFGLRQRGDTRERIAARVAETAGRLGLSELLDRAPRKLSGGQRQRVALGRAIIREPQAFLMDEPLSNLDAMLRVEMRAYISRLQGELRTTTVYVTHDQVEAMTMGDRVAVMRNGCLEQVDVPQALYERPANAFVAGFIGSPSMNLLRARLERGAEGLRAVLGSQRIGIPQSALARHRSLAGYADRDVIVGIRPETMAGATPARANGTLDGEVLLVESLGSDAIAHVEIDTRVLAPEDVLGEPAEAAEERPGVALETGHARLTARLPIHEAPRPGSRLSLVIDPESLHFFDPDDGRALD